MLFAEDHAQLLLILHTVLAAALVAATTHLVVWMRSFPRGRFVRMRAVRRFALTAAALFALNMIVGNIAYPVYKVRVRAEYLEQSSALLRDYRERLSIREQVKARYLRSVGRAPSAPDLVPENAIVARSANLPAETTRVARWFDVKEHWAALGMILSIACAVILLAWNPRQHSRVVASVAFLMAFGAALSAWLSAVVGIVVSSYRSIAGLG